MERPVVRLHRLHRYNLRRHRLQGLVIYPIDEFVKVGIGTRIGIESARAGAKHIKVYHRIDIFHS